MTDKNIKPTDIDRIQENIEYLKNVGLTEDMIISLIRDKTKIAKRDIRKVLEGLNGLARTIKYRSKMKWEDD